MHVKPLVSLSCQITYDAGAVTQVITLHKSILLEKNWSLVFKKKNTSLILKREEHTFQLDISKPPPFLKKGSSVPYLKWTLQRLDFFFFITSISASFTRPTVPSTIPICPHLSSPRTKWELVFLEKRHIDQPSSEFDEGRSTHQHHHHHPFIYPTCLPPGCEAAAIVRPQTWSIPTMFHHCQEMRCVECGQLIEFTADDGSPVFSKVGDDVSGIKAATVLLPHLPTKPEYVNGLRTHSKYTYGHRGFVLDGISVISWRRKHWWRDQDNNSQCWFALRQGWAII